MTESAIAYPERRVRFSYPDDLDAAWIRSLPEFAYAANGVSLLMPYAEPLFMQAARRGMELLPDDAVELRARTEEYVRQEAAHCAEHRRFNELLRAQHPGVRRVERMMKWIADWIGRRSTKFNMAFTSSGEIMSFLLARWADANAPKVFATADPVAASLFLWHLAEEMEHKSAAWDLYEEIDGSKLRYATAMLLGLFVLGLSAWLCAFVMLKDDRRLFSPVSHFRLFRWSLSLAFHMFPPMFVAALPGQRVRDLPDPPYLRMWLAQYDPETRTMPLWQSSGRSA